MFPQNHLYPAWLLALICLSPGLAQATDIDRIIPLAGDCHLHLRQPAWFSEDENESRWTYGCGHGPHRVLGRTVSAMAQVSDAQPSPGWHYLAVVSVGEGHPILEVIDLQAFIGRREWQVLLEVNPFPGTLSVSGWEGSQLRVSSDMNLDRLKTTGQLTDSDLTGDYRDYLLQPAARP